MPYYARIEPMPGEFHRIEAESIDEVHDRIIKAMATARNNIIYYFVGLGVYLAITKATDFYAMSGLIPWIALCVVSAGFSAFFRPYLQIRILRLWNSAIIQNEPASHY